ncbi:MAG: hypothetical protein AMJ53_14145 [Gammaproteobacteria bacterium SG8_11]|nr:MAG: hypothetical protein AMJ53_14145 [Gammaproteobacteria bacterium SG8_11]
MKIKIIRSSVILMSTLVFACSSGSEEPKQDHVFKGYENALEKANQVQPQLDEAEEKRRKQFEESMR